MGSGSAFLDRTGGERYSEVAKMTPTDIVATTAIGFSVMAMTACIIVTPLVFRKGAVIQSELSEFMFAFKVTVVIGKQRRMTSC